MYYCGDKKVEEKKLRPRERYSKERKRKARKREREIIRKKLGEREQHNHTKTGRNSKPVSLNTL